MGMHLAMSGAGSSSPSVPSFFATVLIRFCSSFSLSFDWSEQVHFADPLTVQTKLLKNRYGRQIPTM